MAGKTSPAVHFIQHFSNFRVREHAINQIAKGDAAEGTLLSSGVIFTPLSEISTSGKSPASAIALTSSRRDARSVKRLLMYSWQSAGTARGNWLSRSDFSKSSDGIR